MSEFGTAPSPTVARWVRFRRDVWGRLRALSIPTVAAVHGFAVGGGLEMVLLCDIAIAADDASFCLPETGLGMIPGVAGTQTASRRLGAGRALDLCLTGRWIDANQALAIGLVAEVVPAAALMRAAGRWPVAWAACRASGSRWRSWRSGTAWTCRLDEGLAMERRLARRLENLRLEKRATGGHFRPQEGAPPWRKRSTVNTVSFISIPGSIAPDQEILVFGDRRLNYAQLNELVGRLSSSFKTLGLKPRDVVAALDTNSDNYIAGYYAAAKAGLTWLPLNYRAKDAELEYMINTAGAKVLLAGDRYLDLMARVSPELKTAKVVAWGEGKAGMPRLADLVKAAEVDEGEVEVDDEDVSVLMYTSGTTSLPKGVMLRFRDFAAYVTANVEMADGSERGRRAGVRAVLPYRRHHRDDDQPVDRAADGGDAAVRSEKLAATGRAREGHARLRRADHDEAVARRAVVRQDRFLEPHQSRVRRRRDADSDHPPRDRGVPQIRRLRQRLRPDRDHLIADRARPRRPSD